MISRIAHTRSEIWLQGYFIRVSNTMQTFQQGYVLITRTPHMGVSYM